MNLEEELIALFERLVSELAPNVAQLEIQRPKQHGVVTVLAPTNSAAARIFAHTENGLGIVDFSFGDYSPTWELPYEGHNSKANKTELLREIKAMCRAVIAGNCEHKRGLMSISAIILAGNRPFRITDLLKFRVVPPLHGIRKYEPYISGSLGAR